MFRKLLEYGGIVVAVIVVILALCWICLLLGFDFIFQTGEFSDKPQEGWQCQGRYGGFI